MRGGCRHPHKNGHVPLHEGRNELPPSLNRGNQRVHSGLRVRDGCAGKAPNTLDARACHTVHIASRSSFTPRSRNASARLANAFSGAQPAIEIVLADLKELWERDFVSNDRGDESKIRRMTAPDQATQHLGMRSSPRLADAVGDIQVRMINGTAKDALDYAENQETGLKVIAIGGDKLARGLTLEGLDRQLLPARLEDVRHPHADGALVRLSARLSRSWPSLHDSENSSSGSSTLRTPPRSFAKSSISWSPAAQRRVNMASRCSPTRS